MSNVNPAPGPSHLPPLGRRTADAEKTALVWEFEDWIPEPSLALAGCETFNLFLGEPYLGLNL